MPALPGLTLIRADLNGHRFPVHMHPEYVVGVSEKGRHRARRTIGELLLTPGHVSVVEPGETHAAEALPGEPWTWRAFYVAAPALVELLGGEAPRPEPVLERPGLARALLRAHRELEGGDEAAGGARFRECLEGLFGGGPLSEAAVPSRSPLEDVRVARARTLIDARFREPVTLEELAGESGCSRYHLVRLFRRTLGLTPYEYLIEVRIREAQELLAAGSRIAETAHAVGFADQSHLTRHFKRRLGVTPGAYGRPRGRRG